MNLGEAIVIYQQMCAECREKRSRLPILGEPPCEKCAVYVAIHSMKKELKQQINNGCYDGVGKLKFDDTMMYADTDSIIRRYVK